MSAIGGAVTTAAAAVAGTVASIGSAIVAGVGAIGSAIGAGLGYVGGALVTIGKFAAGALGFGGTATATAATAATTATASGTVVGGAVATTAAETAAVATAATVTTTATTTVGAGITLGKIGSAFKAVSAAAGLYSMFRKPEDPNAKLRFEPLTKLNRNMDRAQYGSLYLSPGGTSPNWVDKLYDTSPGGMDTRMGNIEDQANRADAALDRSIQIGPNNVRQLDGSVAPKPGIQTGQAAPAPDSKGGSK